MSHADHACLIMLGVAVAAFAAFAAYAGGGCPSRCSCLLLPALRTALRPSARELPCPANFGLVEET